VQFCPANFFGVTSGLAMHEILFSGDARPQIQVDVELQGFS